MLAAIQGIQRFAAYSVGFCFGAIYLTLPAAADTKSQSLGGWKLSTSINPMSDVSSYWISKPSTDGEVSLALKCDEKGSGPYLTFVWGTNVELVGLDKMSARLRIDKDEPTRVAASGYHDTAQIGPEGLGLIASRLKSGNQLAFNFHYYSISEFVACMDSPAFKAGLRDCGVRKSDVSGTVSLSGSTKAIEWLTSHCGSLPEPSKIAELNDAQIALAQKLKADAEAKLQLKLGTELTHRFGAVKANIRMKNSTDYYFCNESVDKTGSSRFHVFFYQKGIELGSDHGYYTDTVKDDVGLDTTCIAAPNSVRDIMLELPKTSTPDALLLKQEFDLQTEDLMANDGGELIKVTLFKLDELRVRNGSFFTLARTRDENGRYSYKHTAVDWNEEAKRALQSDAAGEQ